MLMVPDALISSSVRYTTPEPEAAALPEAAAEPEAEEPPHAVRTAAADTGPHDYSGIR